MAHGYAAQNVDPETTAKALGRDLPIKPKYAVNVCRAIKGKDVAAAKAYLEKVIDLEQAVPFFRFKGAAKHHKTSNGPGRYPVNVAKAVLKVVKEAESNAEYKGLDPEKMVVKHAATHRAAPTPNYRPRARGRASPWFKANAHVEIVIAERGETTSGTRVATPGRKGGGD